MVKECEFCNLIKTHKCSVVFESDTVFAFMDKHPVNKGHVLVIPKKHEPDFENLSDEVYMDLMKVTKKISKVLKRLTGCTKIGILISGFDIPHAHIHVIPMFDKKDVCTKRLFQDKFIESPPDELSEISRKIKLELRRSLKDN